MHNAVIQEYISAFNTAYPQKTIGVSFSHKQQGEEHFSVSIDHDKGGRTLTVSDMREATRQFNRGK